MTSQMTPTPDESLSEMPVMEHFAELRRRVIRILAAWVIGILVCFNYSPEIYRWLAEPLQGALGKESSLIFTSPIEPFLVYLKVSLIASIFLTSPYTFWQIWRFIAPGLYAHEKRTIVPIAMASSLIFIGGAAFCYYVVLPLGMQALLGAGQSEAFTADAMITMQSNFALTTRLAIAFGLVFEMPVFSLFLTRLGLIDHHFLIKQWRIAVVIIFIIAALLTPPDVVTQICLGLPMCALYVLSIFLSWMVQRRIDSSERSDAVESAKLGAS